MVKFKKIIIKKFWPRRDLYRDISNFSILRTFYWPSTFRLWIFRVSALLWSEAQFSIFKILVVLHLVVSNYNLHPKKSTELNEIYNINSNFRRSIKQIPFQTVKFAISGRSRDVSYAVLCVLQCSRLRVPNSGQISFKNGSFNFCEDWRRQQRFALGIQYESLSLNSIFPSKKVNFSIPKRKQILARHKQPYSEN